MRAAWLLLAVVVLPAAQGEALLHGRLTPATAQRTIGAGDDGTLDVAWRVDFENTTCTAPVEVGVDLIVGDAPLWAGADFTPDAAQTKYPGGQGTTTLDVFVDADAPVGADGQIGLALQLNPFNGAGACSPVPRIQAEGAVVRVHVGAPVSSTGATASTTTSASSKTNGTPGFEAILLAAAVAAAFRRVR